MAGFGEEIKRLRLESGLTQVQLSEAVGITQGSIASLESGRLAGVSVETLYALSRALGVDCRHWEQFFTEPPVEQPAPEKRGKKKKRD